MAKKKSSTTFNTFFEDIEETFPGTLIRDIEESKINVLPTGVTSIDVALGIGGIPKGRFTEIFGPESSCKTTLALHISRESVRRGENVLYIDVEQTTDLTRVKEILEEDYDENSFMLVKPRLLEDALRIAEIAVQSGKFQTIILDSIAALSPKKVVDEDDLFDANVALVSGKLQIFLQRNQFSIRKYDVAFIGINQIRDTFGSYIRGTHSPGGHAWKHICSAIIELKKGTKVKQIVGGETNIIGIDVPFVITKNKLAPPFRAYSFPLMFNTGKIDTVTDLVNFATTCGILVKGSGYYKLDDEVIAHGKDNLVTLLENDKNTLDKIKSMLYNTVITNVKELDDGQEFIEDTGS
jgi:recombination protein RecA